MEYRTLGASDVSVSAIGLGCWTLGGPAWEEGRAKGWAPVNQDEAIAAVHYALEQGVTHFDNADVYGDGAAERLLATALGAHTTRVVVASKVGHFRGTAAHAYEPLHIRHQCEQSLYNLRREYLDLYYFHHGDFGPDDCYLDDAVAMMEKLRQEGKIRLIGLSAYSVRDFLRLVPRIRPTVVQSWAHAMDYHFIAADSPLMRLCEEYRMSFVAFSPLNQGILLDKYSPLAPPQFGEGDHRQRSEKFTAGYLQGAAAGLQQIKERFGATPEDLARVALQFVLAHRHVAGVIPGFRNVNQVRINLVGAGAPLNGEELAVVRKAFAQ